MGKKKASKFNDVPSSGRVNRRDAHRDKVAGDALAPSTVIPTEEDDDDVDIEQLVSSSVAISVRVCLWEFGQNDPNRYLNIILLMYELIIKSVIDAEIAEVKCAGLGMQQEFASVNHFLGLYYHQRHQLTSLPKMQK